MADGRFGCEADMAGPATGSTRSLVTRRRHELGMSRCNAQRPSTSKDVLIAGLVRGAT